MLPKKPHTCSSSHCVDAKSQYFHFSWQDIPPKLSGCCVSVVSRAVPPLDALQITNPLLRGRLPNIGFRFWRRPSLRHWHSSFSVWTLSLWSHCSVKVGGVKPKKKKSCRKKEPESWNVILKRRKRKAEGDQDVLFYFSPFLPHPPTRPPTTTSRYVLTFNPHIRALFFPTSSLLFPPSF